MFEKSTRVARRVLSVGGALGAVLLLANSCSRQTVTVQLHPFQASGDVAYVCRTPQGASRPLADCSPATIARGELDLYALMTQTATGEVAVINVPNDPASLHSGEGIVDVDPSVPGYGFLHVGGLPSKIVSTPGGSLSVVAVTEAGKPGLFALPTKCVGAPTPGASGAVGTDRDLLSWPACSLPAAPGSLAIVTAPETDTLCDGSPSPRASLVASAEDLSCVAELALPEGEGGPKGRRKIVVTLPDRGSIAVIDAAWLAQGTSPGDFSDCLIEAELPLNPKFEPKSQTLPEDLRDPGAKDGSANQSAQPGPFRARPAGLALDHNTLYVADSDAPLIHEVDLSNPCRPVENPPLLTRSLDRPDRIVTTSRLAVSPLTPSGRKFVYAIDQYDSPTASIMAFDVSPGATDRTPIVRPRSWQISSEPPDRIQFPSAPRDITFFERDRPVFDPLTGNIVEGVSCDPTPGNSGVGISYQSTPEYVSGARAVELRGVFGGALLTSGQVAVIDVEDFDAPCRRPVSINPNPSEEDFRGCLGDPAVAGGAFVNGEGFRTVTDEVSCRMVEPHRARSSSLGLTDPTRGIHAPSLRGFPQLRSPDEASQLMPDDKPRLRAVDFTLRPDEKTESPAPAEVFVGTGLYRSDSIDSPLDVTPAAALERHSVALPFAEPRAYLGSDTLTLTYEGTLTEPLPAGFLRIDDPNRPFTDEAFTLYDPSVGFCDRGVHDEALMESTAKAQFGLNGSAAQDFGRAHADYVQLVGKFPDADDAYWKHAELGCERDACIATFGDYDPALASSKPSSAREFRVVDALQQWLKIEPRNASGTDADTLKSMAVCCYPSGATYVVRASGHWVLRSDSGSVRHRVRAQLQQPDESHLYKQQQLDCQFDPSPRKRGFETRVFEMCTGTGCGECKYKNADVGVTAADKEAAKCVYNSPTARFAVYRGAKPSVRDMAFNWQTMGGFVPMRIDFSVLSPQVSPNALVPVPSMDWLTVVDGSSLGLVLLSLDKLAPLSPALN